MAPSLVTETCAVSFLFFRGGVTTVIVDWSTKVPGTTSISVEGKVVENLT